MLSCGRSAWSVAIEALGIVFALTCAAYASDSSASSWPLDDSAKLVTGACPASQAEALAKLNADCRYLVVPENRTKRNGRKIRLPVAIIPSLSQPPLPDPIVHMTGGPGGNALAEATLLVQFGFNQKRNLIIMDQRGNKDTQPELTCPAIDEFNNQVIGLPYNADSTRQAHLAATRECHNDFVNRGIDLSAYNTTENAYDFADLRKALKIKQWNIYGFSYGTYLALSFLRDHPEGIRSVIIDSVAPPSVATLGRTWTNANEGINNIFRACAAKPACKSKYGDLAGTFASLVQQYEAHPLTTTAKNPKGEDVSVVIDGGHLVNWLAAVIQPDSPVPGLPAAIDALAHDDPTPIATSRAFFTDPSDNGTFGHGLAYGVFCSEWVPFEPASELLTQGRLAFPAYPDSVLSQAPQLPFMTEDCAIWNVPKAPPSVRQATISSVPALVITASFDGRTSPQWGVFAAGNLENSTNIVIPGDTMAGEPVGVGHWATAFSPCARKVIASFLAKPLAPDTSCVAALKPPPFSSSVIVTLPDEIDEDLIDFAN